MPVANVNAASRLRIQFIDSIDLDGKEKLSSKTYSSIKADVTDQDLYDIALGIAALQSKPVKAVFRADEKELVEA